MARRKPDASRARVFLLNISVANTRVNQRAATTTLYCNLEGPAVILMDEQRCMDVLHAAAPLIALLKSWLAASGVIEKRQAQAKEGRKVHD